MTSNPEAKPMLTKEERDAALKESVKDGAISNIVFAELVKLTLASHDAADARIAELEAMLAEREWRPIESAPKDGTWVLLFQSTEEPIVEAKWLSDQASGAFWFCDNGDCHDAADITHWMPLPAAPRAPMGSRPMAETAMRLALLLTEIAELAHGECPECEGDGPPEACAICFQYADAARCARRDALGLPNVIGAPVDPEDGRSIDEITRILSGEQFRTFASLIWASERSRCRF